MSDYIPLGSDSKLYRNTGTHASPTWVECPNVADLETGPIGSDLIELGIRGMGRKKSYVKGQKDQKIKGKMVWRKDSSHELYPDIQAILDAGNSDTDLIELLALDGDKDTAGNEGLRMTCVVKLESRTEQLGEFLSLGFEASQGVTDNATEWYVAS